MVRWLGVVTLLVCATASAARAQAVLPLIELEQRAAADPHDPAASYDLALGYHAAYDLPRAIEQYRRALALDPTNTQVHTSLQTALTEWGLLQESLAQYRTTFGQARREAGAAFNLALAAERHGLIEEAIAQYERYLALAPYATDHASVALRVGVMRGAIGERHIRIRRLTTKPAVVQPGKRARIVFSYDVRGWGKRNRTGVIERVSLYRGEEETHRFVQRSIRRTDKRYVAHMEILVPPDAAPGPYSLRAEVIAGSRRDAQVAVFIIAPRPLDLPKPVRQAVRATRP